MRYLTQDVNKCETNADNEKPEKSSYSSYRRLKCHGYIANLHCSSSIVGSLTTVWCWWFARVPNTTTADWCSPISRDISTILKKTSFNRAPKEGVWYPNIPISKSCYPPAESPSRWIDIPISQYPNFNKPNMQISLFYRLISQYPCFSDQYTPIFSDIPISRFGLPGPL